jgi:hypothetical protein
MKRRENDQTVMYRTDSEADFIRQNIENLIEARKLVGRVTAKVQDVGDGSSSTTRGRGCKSGQDATRTLRVGRRLSVCKCYSDISPSL